MLMTGDIMNMIYIEMVKIITTKPLNQNSMKRIFEIYFGWFFVNGRKQEDWYKYLRERYGFSR